MWLSSAVIYHTEQAPPVYIFPCFSEDSSRNHGTLAEPWESFVQKIPGLGQECFRQFDFLQMPRKRPEVSSIVIGAKSEE